MTATRRISDALFPRGFEVASPRRSLESSRKPSSCIRRSMYPRRKKFFFPNQKGFCFFQPQRNNSRRQQPQRGRWWRGGSTSGTAAAVQKRGKCAQLMEARWRKRSSSFRTQTADLWRSPIPALLRIRALHLSILFYFSIYTFPKRGTNQRAAAAAAAAKRDKCS